MSIKKAVCILSICLLLPLSIFCLAGNSESADLKEITWQVWITPNLTRVFYDEVVAAFEQQYPDVKVNIVEANAAVTPKANDFIKTRIAAGEVPDVMQNHDVRPFADAGILWEMPLDDPDLKKVRDVMAAAYDGKLYAFDNSLQPQSNIFYNKKLWAEVGLSDADVPTTWAEFEAVCEKIKAKGLVPIITGGQWVPGYLLDGVLASSLGKDYPNFWTDYYAGKIKFTDEPVLEIVAFFKGLYDKGYFNPGALSIGYADLEQQFLRGEAVMYPMGSWFTAAEARAEKDWEAGVFAFPTKDGTLSLSRSAKFGSSCSVYAKSKYPQEAYALVKFFAMDPVYGAKFLEVDGLFSNLDPPLTYDMSPLQEELAALAARADYLPGVLSHVRGDPSPDGLFDVLMNAGQTILAGAAEDLPALLEEFDDFVADSLQ